MNTWTYLLQNEKEIKMGQTSESKTYTDVLVQKYIQTLNEKEYKSYQIAKDHLGTLFDIERTNGFLNWKKKQNL